MRKNLSISHSVLAAYETCPKQYYHLRVKKDYREPESEALRVGNRIHKDLELRVTQKKPLPEDLAFLEPRLAAFLASGMTVRAEWALAIDGYWKPCDWWGPDVFCRAKLDLCLLSGEQAVIIDYKTGRFKEGRFEQLGLAAGMLLLHCPEIQTIDVAYLWVKQGGTLSRHRYSRLDAMAIWDEIIPQYNRLQAAHQDNDFPPNPSGLCKRWCIVDCCPYHGGKLS